MSIVRNALRDAAKIEASGNLGRVEVRLCGQPLRDRQAVRQLRKSKLDFERTVQAAVTARIAELADELGVDLAEKHQEMLERLQRRDDVSEEQLASARACHAEDMDKLRVLFRRF